MTTTDSAGRCLGCGAPRDGACEYCNDPRDDTGHRSYDERAWMNSGITIGTASSIRAPYTIKDVEFRPLTPEPR